MKQCKRHRKLGESCADPGDQCTLGSQRCEQGVCTAVTSQHLRDALRAVTRPRGRCTGAAERRDA